MRLAARGYGRMPRWVALALAGTSLIAACTPPAWRTAGETAVARDTAGPTLVVLPHTTAPNVATQTAAATLQTPLAAAPSATVAVPTSQTPGDVDLTLEPCADQDCAAAASHLWMGRPIPSSAGHVDFVERSYPYGSTQNGQREPHHGVEFANPSTTPVIAVAAGRVVVAGEDLAEIYGPQPDFYGRLVVIEHDETYAGRPVFSLYGHLRSVAVTVGDRVAAGDLLGQVGAAGVAIGPHLHFEVRVDSNDYYSTRNPELWLLPLPYNGRPNGVIAGRVLDLEGNPIPEVTVAIRPISTESDQPRNRFVQTYTNSPDLNPDDQLQENFAIGDVPRGLYSISVSTTRFFQQTITVIEGQVTLVEFVVPRPQITATPAVTDTPTADPNSLTPTLEGTPLETPVLSETPTGEAAPTVEATPTLELPPSETPTPG